MPGSDAVPAGVLLHAPQHRPPHRPPRFHEQNQREESATDGMSQESTRRSEERSRHSEGNGRRFPTRGRYGRSFRKSAVGSSAAGEAVGMGDRLAGTWVGRLLRLKSRGEVVQADSLGVVLGASLVAVKSATMVQRVFRERELMCKLVMSPSLAHH